MGNIVETCLPTNLNELSASEAITLIYDEVKRLNAVLCWIDSCWLENKYRRTFFSYNFDLNSPSINLEDQEFINKCHKIAVKNQMPLLVLTSNFWGFKELNFIT